VAISRHSVLGRRFPRLSAPSRPVAGLAYACAGACCPEFDFRYNNRMALGVDDENRVDNLLRGIIGKRLTYRTANSGKT
jgi:hypothetical protein